ncbi:MAG TPA: peptidoglycan recognition family protein [Candidatus Angelobacter sp.]|nr:peptidoglycan recognition family protein [Candidatus Angelobacter sp.]
MPQWKGIVGQGFTGADFQNYASTIQFDLWRPQFVVVHNTQLPKLSDWHKKSGESHMQELQKYYRDVQHWSAGPHLFVADDLIWVFTPLNTPGVHSPSWNAISWGVEIVGDYDLEPLSDGTRENAVTALSALHALAGLDPQGLHIHKEDPKTTHKYCPGKNIVKADFITWITERLDQNSSGNPGTDADAPGQ